MVFSLFKKGSTAPKPAEENSRYFKLKIKKVVRETDDSISLYFDPAGRTIPYKPGQFFTLILQIDGKEVRRSYSLCTSPDTDEFPGVTIKRVPDGLVSNYLNDHAKAGDEIQLMEPTGHFTTELDAQNQRHLVFFGGGSGITPLMGISKSVLLKEPKSKITLVYANRNIQSIIFKSTFEKMEVESNGRLQIIHVLEMPPVGWDGYSGRLSPAIIGDVLAKVSDKGTVSEYFMCGPEGMMNAVSDAFRELGLPKEKLRKESFTAPSTTKTEVKPTAAEKDAHEVKVIYDGEEYSFKVEPGKTILETALDKDIDLPYSCQSGLCTACRGKCLSGKVRMDEMEGLSESEINEGYVLTCVGHPLTDDVVIEIG
jgi:ring-1,2-phenylacetyl-CoA epoxidase subunit PaaE